MQQAIVYIRFSTLEQREGVSLDRQRERCLEMCEANGWDVETVLVDEGKSAFSGKHREAGAAFGDFEEQARHGVHAGKVLVVERLSRLSRLDYNETYDLMRVLTKGGVTVATWDGSKIYKASEPIDFVSVIELLVKAKTANEESMVKSDFGKDRWARRRAAAKEGKVATKLGPPWLELTDDRKWRVREDRAAIVRQIFDWADDGDGSMRISRRLNELGVQPWPRFANRVPQAWDRKMVARIMTNPAVIGELHPNRKEDGQFIATGEIVRGYFPTIIDAELFERVSLAAGDRAALRGGGQSSVVSNIASTLTRCGSCGGSMEYVATRKKGTVIVRDGKEQAPIKQDHGYLYCRLAHRKGPCDNKASIAYVGFERSLIDVALHLAMDDSNFSRTEEVGRLSMLIADRRRDHDAVTQRAKTFWTAYADRPSDMAAQMAHDAEDKARAISAEIDELEAQKRKAAGEASAAEHLSRLNEIRDRLHDDDLDVRRANRLKVAAGLRSVIERIDCRDDRTVIVNFREGMRVVAIKPGRGRRPPEVMDFDLVHPARDLPVAAENQKRVASYLKRSGKDGVKVVPT
ncbi:recombinase family protein [Sphingobium yanoikuyae]|uniref:recombinase family protein n=1 Tax=Sphingobium yanoikuyae TaxID=13690 RepID=UPI001378B62A|nr:recombinase family protein [Sphingobium yanoikuyae]NBB38642.1 recombinase family protein [Sphingobium yanoikuyae]